MSMFGVKGAFMTPSEALRALCAGWERGDNDAIADLFAADGVYEDPLLPRILQGRDDIRAVNADVVSSLDECTITLRRVLEDSDAVFAEGYFASRLRDNGARLDFPFAIVIEMREGRIARVAEYFDTRPLMA
jgi:ketosteroid isomerase-like protein